jgi:predicted lipoprotein
MTLQQTAKIALSILALLAHAAVSEAAEPPSHTAIVQAAIEKHVIPHIDALKEAAAQLPGAVASMCRTGSAAAKEDLSSRFRNVVKAYAGIDFLRFGPMLEGGRRERLSFWPDPRGFVGRQLRLILLNKDEAVVQPGAIAKQSVAVQGLSALEGLMTDKEFPLGPGEALRYRCELAEAIAANIVSVADEISDGWEKPGGWKDKMLHPGADNDTYKSPEESAGEFVKALLVGLSLTADLQLKPQVKPGVKLVPPFQKSGLQKAFYASSVESLRSLYDALDLEDYLAPDKDWIKNWTGGAWRAIESSDGVGGRARRAPRNDAPPLREVFDKMNGLRKLVIGEMSVAAGLTVGFNELDGD